MSKKDVKDKIPKIVDYNIILYTDGGSKPNPGYTGYGIHGYLYKTDELKKTSNKPNKFIITTDGYIQDAYTNRYKDKLVSPDFFVDLVNSTPILDKTNNFAEIRAISEALSFCLHIDTYSIEHNIKINIRDITILTDSEYALSRTELTNSDLSPDTPNKDIIEELINLIKLVKQKDIIIRFKKILGHAGLIGNELADTLATIGRVLSERNMNNLRDTDIFKLRPASKYWSKQKTLHPFINFPNLYYLPNVSRDNEFIVIKQDTDEPIGKRLNESLYGYALLDTDKIIEDYKELYDIRHMCNKETKNNMVSGISTNNLYSPIVFNYYTKFGINYLKYSSRGLGYTINTLDNVELCRSVYPPSLSKLAYDLSLEMVDILTAFKFGRKDKSISHIDITNVFYTKDKNDKLIFRPEIKNDKYQIDIKVKGIYNIKVPLQLGKDILPRNNLKRLEKKDVSVHLVLKVIRNNNTNVVKYFTIISLDNKEYSIWTNINVNKLITTNT